MVQVIRKATSVLCSDKFWLYAIAMLSHQSKVSCKILKFTESCAIHPKVVHHFDNELQNIPDSWTHFLYYFLDIGRLCIFAKTHDPQGKCVLLHEIGGIYLPKVTQ